MPLLPETLALAVQDRQIGDLTAPEATTSPQPAPLPLRAAPGPLRAAGPDLSPGSPPSPVEAPLLPRHDHSAAEHRHAPVSSPRASSSHWRLTLPSFLACRSRHRAQEAAVAMALAGAR